jgi:dihydrofolate reductase
VDGRELEGLVGGRAPVSRPGVRTDASSADADRDEGGTVFHFVTDGIESALRQARDAARGLDVRLGGGVATIRQYLRAALIDELHLAISPVLLGAGEHLLHGIDTRALGYECAEHAPSKRAAAHVVLRKRT